MVPKSQWFFGNSTNFRFQSMFYLCALRKPPKHRRKLNNWESEMLLINFCTFSFFFFINEEVSNVRYVYHMLSLFMKPLFNAQNFSIGKIPMRSLKLLSMHWSFPSLFHTDFVQLRRKYLCLMYFKYSFCLKLFNVVNKMACKNRHDAFGNIAKSEIEIEAQNQF